MKFDLHAKFTFSTNVSHLQKELTAFLNKSGQQLFKQETANVTIHPPEIRNNMLTLHISSEGLFRPHNALLQMKNHLSKEFGKQHHLGVRETLVSNYTIEFELEQKPVHEVTIPFAQVTTHGTIASMKLTDVSEEFLRRNYIDRMINLIKEKVNNQFYEGKGEFWKQIWSSNQKKPVWSKDPTEEMLKLGWLKQGPTKGKWFYRPQITAIFRAMETIALQEVLKPLGFLEIMESHLVPFDIWLKTGHLEGMPGEFYYVQEPASRDVEQWQHFIDLTKITHEVPIEELKKNLSTASSGICYAQCPVIYWSFKGTTISEKSLPILIYDKTANSCRYESGGRHGIERVDEFHRIEPVYIGTREQLLTLRDKFIERYKQVFNNILDLEWRMAWVTPWYMQQAGKAGAGEEQDCGTIDFEAYMPYRGNRSTSEWLEFQNLSILGDKYVKAFNIKAQKSELWSGCSGIGLERWTIAFLAQKGLNPQNWPDKFQHYLSELPKKIEFL